MQLFLSDVGGSEIVLILFFILIFFGAKSIPGIARTAGRTMRQIKDASQDIQNEIKKSGEGIRKDLNVQNLLEESVDDLQKPFEKEFKTLDQAFEENTTRPNSFSRPHGLPANPETPKLDQGKIEE